MVVNKNELRIFRLEDNKYSKSNYQDFAFAIDNESFFLFASNHPTTEGPDVITREQCISADIDIVPMNLTYEEISKGERGTSANLLNDEADTYTCKDNFVVKII